MRRFLSILFVVLLLFSLLAVPASAMSAGAVVTAVDGLAAVSAIIAGSGVTIRALEQFDAWNTLVSSASEYLTAQNIIDAVGTIAALKSGSKIYFPSSVVQSVKDWLFSSETIVPPTVSYETFTSSDGKYYFISSNGEKLYCCTQRYKEYKFDSTTGEIWRYQFLHYVASKSSFEIYDNGSYWGKGTLCDYGFYWFCYGSEYTRNENLYPYHFAAKSSGRNLDQLNDYLNSVSDTVICPDGITFSEIAPLADISVSENYPAWAESAILYPPVTLPGGTEDDEAIPYLPVSVPVYSSAAPSLPLTQTEVWTGKDLTSTDTDDEEQVIPIAPDLSEPVNSILQLIVQIAADILAIKNAVVTWFTETWAAFTSWLMETLTAIKEAVIALPGLIVAAIEAVAATVTSIWEWLKEVLGLTLQQILEALTAIKAWALGLVDALIAALAALLTEIFGVDIAAVQAAVAELRAEFPFFDSIIVTGESLYNGITSGDPPVIYAHLENAEGALNWGGTVAVLDMSFYARYKSTGDAIISAALYAFFGWRTFVRLPGIISGAGSDIKEVTNHYDI